MTAGRMAALALAAALAVPGHAGAATFHLDFTGAITNSIDLNGTVFGGASSGGQNGLAISGRYIFDSAAYPDQNPSVFTGTYGPTNGLFPQPSNLIGSSFTIDGLTFDGSAFMGPPTQHSLEFASTQDIPPVNFVQQDIYWIQDASQMLLCSNPNDPQTCSGGEIGLSQIALKLFGITDFLPTDAMAQPLDLDAAEITAIVTGPGGGQTNGYAVRETMPQSPFAPLYNISGEFNLTSVQMYQLKDEQPVGTPEPASLALFALGLAGLAAVRRKA